MPFTLAHPIVTLPLSQLSQRRLDLSALVIGAMIPDIAYFIALRPVGNIGHSPLGILIEGIPSGLLLLLIGRYLLWDAVVALLPSTLATKRGLYRDVARRLPPSKHYTFWTVPRRGTMIFFIVIGALTHISWDSATHLHEWTVTKVSWLSQVMGPLPLYKWLQYGGGVIGLALLLAITVHTLRHSPPQHSPLPLSIRKKGTAWLSIALVTGLITWKAIDILPVTHGLTELIIGIVIGIISGTFVGLCLYAVAFWSFRLVSVR